MKFIVRIDDFPLDIQHNPEIELTKFKEIDFILKMNNIPYVLGVIPAVCSEMMFNWLKTRLNYITIAQHGFDHRSIKNSQAPYNEFAGLSRSQTFARILHGREILENAGLSTGIYIPPDNWMSPDIVDALKTFEFTHILGLEDYYDKYLQIEDIQYIVAKKKFYGRSSVLLDTLQKEDLEQETEEPEILTLHCTWEYGEVENYKSLKELCKILDGKVVKFGFLPNP